MAIVLDAATLTGGTLAIKKNDACVTNLLGMRPRPTVLGRRKMETPPSLDDIDRLATAAWEALPRAFRDLAGDVMIRIEDWASEELLDDLEIEDPYELTGLYQGVDLTQRSITEPAPQAPVVFLYRRAILDEWIERGDVSLSDLVAHVLVHEVGHHFGLSDEQMDALLEEAD